VALSLRARLTAWYSVLLLLTLAVFTSAVLWAHWRLLVRQLDESLDSIALTAANVMNEELGEEANVAAAAAEMLSAVKPAGYTVRVLDGDGTPLPAVSAAMPLPPVHAAANVERVTSTLSTADGARWRVTLRAKSAHGKDFFVAVGAPLAGPVAEWRRLLRASLIGIPIALACAAIGGWWLGRHGLRPLTTMAAEAQAITARTPEYRLTVPGTGRELEQLGHAFNHVLQRLGTALAIQRQFMADASHELRTPVSVMRTAADVTLSLPQRDESEYRDALTVVQQQTSRLTRLVDDMLVLARADGAGYPVVMADVDLEEVVAASVRDFRPSADDKQIRVTMRIDPVTMRGDDALLRRMLDNLLGNALLYTPHGGSVTVAVTREDGDVLVRVADTGPGIPEEDRDRVFDRFVRLDPGRAAGGAGLGLAIARWVAEAHGGHMRLESSGAAGSVFAATLPVRGA
jgi:heavy metal sensor kinase